MQKISQDIINKVQELSCKNDDLANKISNIEKEIAKRKISKDDIENYKNGKSNGILIASTVVLFIIFCIIALIIDFFSSYDMDILDIIIITFLFSCFMFYVNHQNNKLIQEFIEYKDIFEENTEHILHLIYPSLKNYINKSGIIDINSIQENGFDFIKSFYLKIYLKDEIERGNIEIIKLPQNNIDIYKTKENFSEISDMTTTHLTID